MSMEPVAPTSAPTTHETAVEIVRAFMLTYCVDRVGRPAPVASRAAAHDALDVLAEGGR